MDSYEGIVEDGVVKLVGPVSLPEQTKVRVVPAEPAHAAAVSDEDVIAKQKAAWRELMKQVESDPRCQGSDNGWSVANNVDDVLYGGPDGPA